VGKVLIAKIVLSVVLSDWLNNKNNLAKS